MKPKAIEQRWVDDLGNDFLQVSLLRYALLYFLYFKIVNILWIFTKFSKNLYFQFNMKANLFLSTTGSDMWRELADLYSY